jgi:hypothetical protein
LCACGTGPKTVAQEQAQTPKGDTVWSRDANDVGRFIAGMPGNDGSPFKGDESNPVWQAHQRELDHAWGRAEKELFAGIRQFQSTELNGSPIVGRPVFYPFSGPDTLTPTLYFPGSPEYIMVALEPAGTLPSAEQIHGKLSAQYLAALRGTVGDILGRSFFITRQMDSQFRGQVTDGLLVPILHLLVRSGHVIHGIEYVRVDENGAVVKRPVGKAVEGQYPNKGVEIEFEKADSGRIQKLFYFSLNLADEKFAFNTGFRKFIADRRDSDSMLKATSYMTHHKNFSVIREVLLQESHAVLQDDSGLPYKSFVTGAWNVQLYGDYEKPYGSFSWLEQPDLRSAYNAGNTKPLPMHIGYGYRRITSNLLLAVKTGS